jgi:hypothetical protein
MKAALIKLLILLYPHAWRQRYGAEYCALLEDMPLTWRMGFDSLRGALDARLHPQWTTFGRWPMKQKRSFRIAGNGAILSALLLVLGMLNAGRITDVEAEFLLLLAPVALLPIVVVLHRLYRPVMPRASLITAVIGILSMGTFLLAFIIGLLLEMANITIAIVSITWFFQILIALIGVWIISAALIGWRAQLLPNGLPAMMATSGLGWATMTIGIILAAQQNNPAAQQYAAIMGAGFVLWLMTHFIWAIWFGGWMWQKAGLYGLEKPATSS